MSKEALISRLVSLGFCHYNGEGVNDSRIEFLSADNVMDEFVFEKVFIKIFLVSILFLTNR